MTSKIKFKVTYKKDIESIRAFINEASFDHGRNLKWAVYKNHPFLKKFIEKKETPDFADIDKYIKETYKKNESSYKNNFKLFESNWRKKEKYFFTLIKSLFGNFKWPKGKYIAFSTIWGMFPRFLEDKTFQIPAEFKNKEYLNVVIAHELLHFIFYEYFYKKYPKYKKSEFNFYVWRISEIFNSLIQNSPSWIKVFNEKTMIYPEHKKIISKIKKDSLVLKNVDSLIETIIKHSKD
ncbi:MAG: hypothetical protein PHZ25_00920 [Candidatus Pacebacteria bacterium]|nr:hypothetical protein [Candidatus Paceibacterota bacterium]